MSADDHREAVGLVCFDLGEVLIRLAGGWSAACAAAGVQPTVRELDAAMHARFLDIVVRNEIGQCDQAAFAAEVAQLTGTDAESVTAVSRAWLQGPYPGVAELLAELKARAAVATACLSNTNALHWEQMHTPDDANYLPLSELDFRFASHLIGHRKPDAPIYAHVEQATAVPAEAILFFDNNAGNVHAARQRGWGAVQVDPRDPVPQMRTALRDHGVM